MRLRSVSRSRWSLEIRFVGVLFVMAAHPLTVASQLAIAKETGRRLGLGDHMYPAKVLKDGPAPGGKHATLDEMIMDADGFAGSVLFSPFRSSSLTPLIVSSPSTSTRSSSVSRVLDTCAL